MKNNTQWAGAVPPKAYIHDYDTGYHGQARNDEYYWMSDFYTEGPESERVLAHLEAENDYTDVMMEDTRGFQERLFLEMKGRIKERDESVPVYNNGYYYYIRSEEGKQYYKYCRKKGSLEAPEEVLLDVDELAVGQAYYSVTGFNVSPDNRLLAYGVDTVSRREYTIHIKDLGTGELLDEVLFPTSGDSVWANDNRTLFYTEKNQKTLLSEKIKRHRLGEDPQQDAVVYHETDSSNYIGVGKTRSRQYIFIASTSTVSSEYRYLNADNPDGDFMVFQSRMADVLYEVDHHEGSFLVLTNLDALNFRLMKCPVDSTGVAAWEELIAHRPDVLLEEIDVFKDYWVISERSNGLVQLRVRQMTDLPEHYVEFGEPAYTVYLGTNPEYNTNSFRLVYTSLTTPSSVYDYAISVRQLDLLKRQEVIGGYDPDDYVTERLYAPSEDGVQVPISLVYRKGFQKDGNAPVLLYGYGSYGHSIDAGFSANRLSLLDRGFVFAIAHIRGGQELGRQWYEDGKLLKKLNTFKDFEACGRYLIGERYTSPEHLYAEGGSAGGLLMGAIANRTPELWNGILADVPFVDVVTTMLDESIPLTTNEFDEWGNPKQREYYDYMLQYSPYDNVRAQDYPHMLVTTGLHDSQVQYFEPAKWVARLRALKTNSHVVLFKTNMEAGHGGASGRFDYLKEIALQYAFLFKLENITH
ncbi:oligopeptidase B [Dyadobacter jejuensis]|uniref:Proline-specific endopeptidase n=1 Tax=Dyadobacter jejuensis TaxID=1082580 RepID=A0A316B8X0_9BACT|nr:S9 family peptidase [Dyadobacter jejuensis]PWJ58987.1 oligopeptidase B [Dyadobacter jejuensis]